MRITQRMIANNNLTNLQRNLSRLNQVQEQMSSGKRVNRLSDDPVATARILTLKNNLAGLSRYTKNMEDAKGFIETSEESLGSIITSLQRVKELMLQGINDTLSDSDREAIAIEIDQIIDEIVQEGNCQQGSQYLFGGQNTTNPPLVRNGDTVIYQGDGGAVKMETAPGITMDLNVDGASLFGASPGGASALFASLFNIKNGLESGDADVLAGNYLTELDQTIDRVILAQVRCGVRENHLQTALDLNSEKDASMTERLSQLQYADLAEVIMEYSTERTAYLAALQVCSQVIQPSLIDYLT